MKKTITGAFELRDEFRAYNRDNFSFEGYEALLEWYDEVDHDMELDVVAIDCEWYEYGNGTEACLSWQSFINDYEYLVKREGAEEEFAEIESEEDRVKFIVNLLEEAGKTFIMLSDSILILNF